MKVFLHNNSYFFEINILYYQFLHKSWCLIRLLGQNILISLRSEYHVLSLVLESCHPPPSPSAKRISESTAAYEIS
jgi:hypothetical protein